MLEQYEEFKKLQIECGNVFLIDENFCVGNSYQIINSNLLSLSTRLMSFQPKIDYYNNLFSYFSQNSSKYYEINNNLEEFAPVFDNMYTYTNQTSANWTRPICFYYDQQIEVVYWNSNHTSLKTGILKTWLDTNHPVSNFTKNQSIILYINLYEDRSFRLDKYFRKDFQEDCKISPRSVTLTCTGDSCSYPPQGGCNIVYQGRKQCINPYLLCGKSASGGAAGNITCPTTGGKTLSVTHTRTAKDRILCTSIGLKYIINNNSWSYSSAI